MKTKLLLPVTRKAGKLNSLAWDLRYWILGRHFGVPADVLNNLGAPASLLDVGCGRGHLLQTLRARGWCGAYEGFDISRYAIIQARKIGDAHALFAVDTIEEFDSHGQKWDTIVMAESIYYIMLDDLRQQMFRYRDMLNPEGRLLVRIHDFSKFNGYVHETMSAGAKKVSPFLMVLSPTTEERDDANEFQGVTMGSTMKGAECKQTH
jgi:2-polyprenyl-3-methyl-5-hydroxy-6-metoxy-1,4-benzoquinol methylase